MELLIMALFLLAVLVGQYFVYSRAGLKGITYTISISKEEAFEDEEIEVIEEIENNKWLPLPWIRTEISASRWLTFLGQEQGAQSGFISSVFMLTSHQKCRRTWRVKCGKRGLYSIEDISLSVSDLFGLTRPSMVIKTAKRVRILPSPANMEQGQMSSEAFIGDIAVERFVLPDPFVISGAKPYTGREPMNRIHWALSAKTGALMAMSSEFTTERKVCIVLNLQRSYMDTRQILSIPVMESQIKAAAFCLDSCYKTRTAASVCANAAKPLSLGLAEGYEHTINALRLLAELPEGCGEHIDDFLARQDFSPYTDVIFITSFMSEKAAERLLTLSQRGIGISVMSAELADCSLCEVIHIPRKAYPHPY